MKFFDAYSSILKTPKETYRDNFQRMVDEKFYNSSDWYTVQEETVYGSGIYQDLDVRINNVVTGRTGMPQGDDYKVFMFKNIEHSVTLGYMYIFENNYWIVINLTKIGSLATTATVRRCNNVLRWINSDGSYYEQPCVIDYGIKENRDYSTAGSKVVSPSGLLKVTTQLNDKTNTIRPNRRFLFGNIGNWTGYRVMGGGIENYNNLATFSNDLTGYMILTMNADYINADEDDLVNGVAELDQNLYSITLSDSIVSGNALGSYQLYAEAQLNGQTVDRTFSWSSSDETIATVDSNGLVSFISDGTCVITCYLKDNQSVYDTCDITVTSLPVSEYQVVISPLKNYVLESSTETFNVTLYMNNVPQPDTFVFNLSSGTIPSNNYVFTVIDGNNFSIENVEKFLLDVLTIECVSGIHSKSFEINLRGLW